MQDTLVTINLSAIGNAILTILGILALIFLIVVLKNVASLLKTISNVVDKNRDSIDTTIEKLPVIVDNADRLVGNINTIVADPNIKMAVAKANDTLTNVSRISEDVKDTVNYFGETAIDTADTLDGGVSSITDYVYMVKDVVDILRNVIASK
ncbi:MAG: hypothetical protein Q4B52_05705 [Tissierellia bacterium]|nr:hypothetical protein [Tissierellia bacterium]